jgi:hypothetical protein
LRSSISGEPKIFCLEARDSWLAGLVVTEIELEVFCPHQPRLPALALPMLPDDKMK